MQDNEKCFGIDSLIFLIVSILGGSISMIILFNNTGRIIFIILSIMIIILFGLCIILILKKCGKK